MSERLLLLEQGVPVFLHLFPLFVVSLLFIQKVQIQLNAGFHYNFFFLIRNSRPNYFWTRPVRVHLNVRPRLRCCQLLEISAAHTWFEL